MELRRNEDELQLVQLEPVSEQVKHDELQL
jgi:hypothetical protein